MVWHQQLHHFSHVALSQRAKNILNLQLPILSTFIDLKWRKRFFPKNSRRSQENWDGYKLIQIVLAASSFLGSGSNFIDIVCWVCICHENQWLWIGMNWVISVNNSNGWLSCLHATLSHVLYSVGCTKKPIFKPSNTNLASSPFHSWRQSIKESIIIPFGLCTSPTSVCHPGIFKLEISFETHKKTRSAWMDFGILKRKSLAGTRSDGIWWNSSWHIFLVAHLWSAKTVWCASLCREENPCVMVSCGLSIYMLAEVAES